VIHGLAGVVNIMGLEIPPLLESFVGYMPRFYPNTVLTLLFRSTRIRFSTGHDTSM
jgi:hypothetical protein